VNILRTNLLSTLILFFSISSLAHAKEDGIESLRQSSKAFAAVAQQVSPSVVFIQVERETAVQTFTQHSLPFGDEWPFQDDLFKRFFGEQNPPWSNDDKLPKQRRSIAQGSGFVFTSKDNFFSDKSFILTNNHVIEKAEKITVKLQDGREFDANITGSDPHSDVAVIEIKNEKLPQLPLGDSAKLEVGEWVVAVGNPFGLSHTLTVGVVSAKGRTSLGINDYEDFIQTDAAINLGNSGGPLVNLDGEVIGINTAIISNYGGYAGIGFAIPINQARNIAEQLINHGEVTRGQLGIVIQELTPDLAKSFDVKQASGILISQVVENSPASKAGLLQGDVITSFQGDPITSVGSFRNKVALTSPGSKVRLSIIRNGKQQNITATVNKLEDDSAPMLTSKQTADEIGLDVQTLTPNLVKQYNLKSDQGVLVSNVKPGTIAAMAGIKSGSVIVQVNRKAVKDAASFKNLIQQSPNKQAMLLIKEGDMQRYVVLKW